MNMNSTYVDRRKENKNEALIDRVLKEINGATPTGEDRPVQEGQAEDGVKWKKGKTRKDILPSLKIKAKAIQVLSHILAAEDDNLLKQVTVNKAEDALVLPPKMRVGRPRVSWLLETAKLAWREWGETDGTGGRVGENEFERESQEKVKTLVRIAKNRIDKDQQGTS